jgi:hypothetical protein
LANSSTQILVLIAIPPVAPSADDVLAKAFQEFGLPRLGGASESGWSRYADFLRCPYLYNLKHMRRVRIPSVSPASKGLEVGSYTHAALALYYAAQLPEGYPGWNANTPTWDQFKESCTKHGALLEHLFEADRMFAGYVEHYGDEPMTPVAVEMGAGIEGRHTSRYDLVFHIEDGFHDGLWIGEHKTLALGDFEVFRHHGEVLGEAYSWCLSQLSEKFEAPLQGVCVNILVKTKKAPTFHRMWLTFPAELVVEYGKNRMHWNSMMEFYRRNGFWPKSLYGCDAKYGRCAFFDHCATLNDKLLESIG